MLFALSLSGAFKVLPHCKHPVGLDYVIAAVGKPAPAEIGVYLPIGDPASPVTLLGIALIADGLENCFVTAYTVRVGAKNKKLEDKFDL